MTRERRDDRRRGDLFSPRRNNSFDRDRRYERDIRPPISDGKGRAIKVFNL